jgi:O-antigen/teichoic acid export membrane protein
LVTYFNLVQIRKIGGDIFTYGGFLIAWYLLSFGISQGNRFVLAYFLGTKEIGHYTASFDVINKSITVILAPVVVSLFPLIVSAYSKGDVVNISRIIRKLTFIEVGVMAVALILFVTVGFPILSYILKTPDTKTYLWIDIQVIVSSFVWQIAMLQHKFLELQKKTVFMLVFIVLAFFVSISLDAFLISKIGIEVASVGFLAGGCIYLIGVLYYNNRYFLKAPQLSGFSGSVT